MSLVLLGCSLHSFAIGTGQGMCHCWNFVQAYETQTLRS
jgi:hypothetical protein